MLKVILWNTNRAPAAALCAGIADEVDANVLVVLDAGESKATYLDALNSDGAGHWHLSDGNCPRVLILTRFPSNFSVVERESQYYSARSIKLPGLPSITMIALHLRSKLHQSDKSQQYEAATLMSTIRDLELQLGHKRTVVFGDFNMDPFEPGMIGTHGFHALASPRTARQGSRIVSGEDYDLFHNPMWGLFGDGVMKAHGTYRYWTAEHVCQEWHLFDQVVVRPDLIDWLPLESILIKRAVGSTQLVSASGIPCVSDHLPLVFELNIPRQS